MELKDITDYPELVEYAGFETLNEQMLGMYQGDWVFVVKPKPSVVSTDKIGFLVIGYGSCSYCDPLEHARDRFSYREEPDYELMERLVDEIKGDVRWFVSMENLIAYAKSEECRLNNWYGSDKEFQQFISVLEVDNGADSH